MLWFSPICTRIHTSKSMLICSQSQDPITTAPGPTFGIATHPPIETHLIQSVPVKKSLQVDEEQGHFLHHHPLTAPPNSHWLFFPLSIFIHRSLACWLAPLLCFQHAAHMFAGGVAGKRGGLGGRREKT